MIVQTTNKLKYKVSIMGDSISTYLGYNPSGFPVFYKEDRIYDYEVESVNDTWWEQVIDGIHGELCINNSYSGSLVAGEFDSSACSTARCSTLQADCNPDIILVYMGTNDRGFKVTIGLDEPHDRTKFYGAYRIMLHQLKLNYPSAKIVCGTLLMGKLKDSIDLAYDRFMFEAPQYNDAIRRAVEEEKCLLADIASFEKRYETLDYCHPTKAGHALISKLWLECLKPLI